MSFFYPFPLAIKKIRCLFSNPSLHGKAIRSIKNLMTSHDLDPRYVEQEAKARVAALYLP